MDSMIFYKPPSASVSQPYRSSVVHVTSAQSLTSTAPVAFVGIARDDASQNFSQRSNWKDQNKIKVANTTDPTLKERPMVQRIRIDDLIQKKENLRRVGNYPNSNSDDDDDDEFPTIEQLADAKKKRMLENIEPSTGSMGEKANNRTRDDGPVGYSGSASSSCQDPIWISDDESDSDFMSEVDCDHPFDADKGPAGGQALDSETTTFSNHLATNLNNDVIHNVQVQSSADGHKSAFCGSSVSHEASELQQNTKVMTDSKKHDGCEGPDELEDYVFDVFAEENDKDDIQTQPKDPAVFSRNSTSNAKISEPQIAQRATQSSELAPTTATFQQLDPKGILPPANRPREGGAERKVPKTSASSIKSTATSSIISTNLEPPDAREPYSGKQITDLNNLWKIRRIIGRKIIRSRVQYHVEWEPTWQLESELAEVKELLNEFEAKLQDAQGKSEGGRGKRDRKTALAVSNKLWEIRNIIGRRMIGCRKQYWVNWKPTWEPESDLADAEELIDEFVTRSENTQGQKGRHGQKRSQSAIKNLDTRGEAEPSKRRRRIQKEM